MSHDQRLEANQLLARARMTNRTAATAPNSIAHLITLFDMVIPALFPVADDLADDPMHPTGRCTCGGGGDCEWCDAHAEDVADETTAAVRLAGRESMVPVAPAAPLTTVDGREWPPDVVSMPAPLATTAAMLDDPRMDGVYWNAATDVSVAMLHAWPFWERWTADSTEVLPCHQVDFGPGANTTHNLRPLRLPGMDASGDGQIAVSLMEPEHFTRCAAWQWRNGHHPIWQSDPGLDGYTDYKPEAGCCGIRDKNEVWRPAIWATLDTAAEVTEPESTLPSPASFIGSPQALRDADDRYFAEKERVRAEVLARTRDVNEPTG